MNTFMSKVYQIYSGNNWMTLSLISSYKGTLDQLIAKNHYYLTETLINSRLNPDLLNFQYTYKEISHWIRIEENPSRWPGHRGHENWDFLTNHSNQIKLKIGFPFFPFEKSSKKYCCGISVLCIFLSNVLVAEKQFFSLLFLSTQFYPTFFFLDYVFQISIL